MLCAFDTVLISAMIPEAEPTTTILPPTESTATMQASTHPTTTTQPASTVPTGTEGIGGQGMIIGSFLSSIFASLLPTLVK